MRSGVRSPYSPPYMTGGGRPSPFLYGLMAQRLAQRTHNPWVVGSNPTGPTNHSTWQDFYLSGFSGFMGLFVKYQSELRGRGSNTVAMCLKILWFLKDVRVEYVVVLYLSYCFSNERGAMTPETRAMKLVSLFLLIGGLLGLVTVVVAVIGNGPKLDSALFLFACMIAILEGGYAARAANVPNQAVDAFSMLLGTTAVLAVITVIQIVVAQSLTVLGVEQLVLLALSVFVTFGSRRVKKSIEAK